MEGPTAEDEAEMEMEPLPGTAENLQVLPPILAARWLAPSTDPTHQLDPLEIRRKCVEVKGRSITLLAFADGRLFGIDSKCYHLGGPLGELGAIEDLVLEPGHLAEAVIACPWHGRKLRLSSGQAIDQYLDGRLFFSDTPAQRTYPAYVEADGAVHIVWSVNPQEIIPSDLVNCPGGPRTPISVSGGGGGGKVVQEAKGAQAARRTNLMKQRQLEHRQAAAQLRSPADDSGAICTPGIASHAERAALSDLYGRHNPDKVGSLEFLIEKYGGTQLLAAAREKYERAASVAPSSPGMPAAPATPLFKPPGNVLVTPLNKPQPLVLDLAPAPKKQQGQQGQQKGSPTSATKRQLSLQEAFARGGSAE